MKQWSMVLLAIWLIAVGLLPLLNLNFPSQDIILGILAIATGVLILLEGRRRKLTKDLGMLLLSIWLIATGLIALLGVTFPAAEQIMAILAVAAGVLLLLKR
jgi:FtsH-binding integral membrane protein